MTSEPISDAPVFALPIDIRVQPGPDGKHWVCFTVQDQFVTASFRLPPAAADQLAAGISGALMKAATEARRADSGIVLADVIPPGHKRGPAHH